MGEFEASVKTSRGNFMGKCLIIFQQNEQIALAVERLRYTFERDVLFMAFSLAHEERRRMAGITFAGLAKTGRFKLFSMNEILEQVMALSRGEKLALIRDITLSLEDEGEQISPADSEELKRRVALADAHPLEGDSWTNVRARVEAQVVTPVQQEKVAA